MAVDFNWVNSRIAFGGHIKSQEDMNSLLAQGITHIVNTQVEKDDAPFLSNSPYDVDYLWVGTSDDHKPKDDFWYLRIIDFCLLALADSRKAKIYIHCAAGKSRSGTAVYAVFRAIGFSSAVVENLLISKRPVVTLEFYKASCEESLKRLGYP